MSGCSHPDCDVDAVSQWQRRSTDEEARAYAEERVASQAAIVASQRGSLQQLLDDCVMHRDAWAEKVAEGVAPQVVVDAQDAQIRDLERRLEELVDPVAPLTPPVVVVAVFGCEEHAVDADSATVLHEATCHGGRPCGCAL